jgi:hypothetical protein
MRKGYMFVITFCGLLCYSFQTATCPAQSVDQGQVLSGYSGQIEVVPNARRKEVTIILKADHLLSQTSDQIVFHLQDDKDEMPSHWTGTGRLLANAWVVAVLPEGKSGGWMFKFPTSPTPPSTAGMKFEMFSTYGIARYGETKPLTQKQIQRLVLEGGIS